MDPRVYAITVVFLMKAFEEELKKNPTELVDLNLTIPEFDPTKTVNKRVFTLVRSKPNLYQHADEDFKYLWESIPYKTYEDWMKFLALIPKETLKSLNLTNNELASIESTDLELLKLLDQFPKNLESLNLTANHLNDKSSDELKNIIEIIDYNLPKLSTLNLEKNNFTAEQLETILEVLQKNSNLDSIKLSCISTYIDPKHPKFAEELDRGKKAIEAINAIAISNMQKKTAYFEKYVTNELFPQNDYEENESINLLPPKENNSEDTEHLKKCYNITFWDNKLESQQENKVEPNQKSISQPETLGDDVDEHAEHVSKSSLK